MIEPIHKPTPKVKVPKPLRSRVRGVSDYIRAQVLQRDGWLCQWCEVPGGALIVHHRLIKSQGGRDTVDNLVSLHALCHQTVHANPTEARRRGLLVGVGSNQ